MKKKKIKSVKTQSLSRSFSLASAGFQIGLRAAGNALGNIFSEDAMKEVKKKALFLSQMKILTEELGKLKGSLMKVGQLLSMYGEHFFSPEVNQVLKTLQTDSPSVEWPEIERILKKELGKQLPSLKIDPEPIGAASLGQVHRAEIKKTGQQIVLKVQYPGVAKAIESDIKSLKKILSLTEWLPNIPATEDLFIEIKEMLVRELDYTKEGKSLELFRERLSKYPQFVVPTHFPDFSTEHVIAMSYEQGDPINENTLSKLSSLQKNLLAQQILDLYFHELFVWRSVQTDPHFGNYRIRLASPPQLVLYDFGAIRDISKIFLQNYKQLLLGLILKNRTEFENAAKQMKILEDGDPQDLKDLFFNLCSAIVEPFAVDGDYDWKNNDLPQRVAKLSWQLIKSFPLRSPPREVVFLDRKMAGVFTLMSTLEAKFNSRKVILSYLQKQ